jgi:AraC-like DNA-binding protein
MNLPKSHPGVPVSYAATFYDFLNNNNLGAEDIYDQVGIDMASFNESANKISVAQYIRLSQLGLAASNNAGLGLIFGSQIALPDHNYLGFALQACENGLQANELMIRYMSMRFPSLDIQLNKHEQHYELIVEDWLDEPSLHLYNLEVVLAVIFKGALSLHRMDRAQRMGAYDESNNDFNNIIEIQFAYPKPDHEHLYHEVFTNQKLSFGHGVCRVILNPKALLKPFSFSNSGSLKLAESLCQQELNQLWETENLTTKIYNVLLNSTIGVSGVEDIAKKFNMSSRSLSRSLHEEGTSYQKILDTVKKQQAIRHLNGGKLTISEIAYQLGFEQPTNFTRAFKKWTGQSPSAYRV